MWEAIWSGVHAEFSDLPGLTEITRVVLRLTMAAILGGLLGFEREKTGHSAGVRTHMLVAMGTAFFLLVPQQAGMTAEGLSRILQGITAGIGFIGAGAILKDTDTGKIRGLTTAAGIWMTAAVGMAIGLGREASAVLGTILSLLILGAVRWKTSQRGVPLS